MIRQSIQNKISEKVNEKMLSKHLPNSSLIYKSFDLDNIPLLFSLSKAKLIIKLQNIITDLFQELNI